MRARQAGADTWAGVIVDPQSDAPPLPPERGELDGKANRGSGGWLGFGAAKRLIYPMMPTKVCEGRITAAVFAGSA